MVCCGQNGIAPLGQNGIMISHCIGLTNIKMQLVLSSHAYNISLTLFSRCTSLIVIIEKYYLVNNMHEECLFIQVRYNTVISPVHFIHTSQTCRIVYYILLYKPKSVALCFRLDQLIAYYCGRPVFPGSESHLTIQSGKMEYSRVNGPFTKKYWY